MKKACVYLLRSRLDGKFYIGYTTDIERRLHEHNKGKSSYTSRDNSWELIGYDSYDTVEEAKKREKNLKNSTRMKSFFKKRLLAAKGVSG